MFKTSCIYSQGTIAHGNIPNTIGNTKDHLPPSLAKMHGLSCMETSTSFWNVLCWHGRDEAIWAKHVPRAKKFHSSQKATNGGVTAVENYKSEAMFMDLGLLLR